MFCTTALPRFVLMPDTPLPCEGLRAGAGPCLSSHHRRGHGSRPQGVLRVQHVASPCPAPNPLKELVASCFVCSFECLMRCLVQLQEEEESPLDFSARRCQGKTAPSECLLVGRVQEALAGKKGRRRNSRTGGWEKSGLGQGRGRQPADQQECTGEPHRLFLTLRLP